MLKKIFASALAVITICVLCACGAPTTALTKDETAALEKLAGTALTDPQDMTSEILSDGREEKFPAVKKAYVCGDNYAFITEPVAYNGPMTLAVLIDGIKGETIGMEIVAEDETPEYVRDYTEGWFESRFAAKSVFDPLHVVKLDAQSSSEIVAITGATVTTQAAVNGVNAAIGAYLEYTGKGSAEAVPINA